MFTCLHHVLLCKFYWNLCYTCTIFEIHAFHTPFLCVLNYMFNYTLYVLIFMILTCLYDISYFCEKEFDMSFCFELYCLSSWICYSHDSCALTILCLLMTLFSWAFLSFKDFECQRLCNLHVSLYMLWFHI